MKPSNNKSSKGGNASTKQEASTELATKEAGAEGSSTGQFNF